MSWLSDAWQGITDLVASGIEDDVGDGRRSQSEDVARTQSFLGALGYLDGEPSGVLDKPFSSGLSRFQREHGLRADGWMRPRGPTETALRDEGMRSLASGWLVRRASDEVLEEESEPNWSTRLNGLGTALAGVAETAVGAAGFALPEPVTSALGAVAMADGANRIGTGIAEIVSGRDFDTLGQRLGRSAGSALGLDEQGARRVGDALDIGLGLAAPTNALGRSGLSVHAMTYPNRPISPAIPGVGITIERHGRRVFSADLHPFEARRGIPWLGVDRKQEVLLPHYHLRRTTPSGQTKPGQGIGRHRPWE